MPYYTTHLELAEHLGALELSEVASDEQAPPVAAELLDALLRGQDASAWAAGEVAAAQRALARIDAAVRDAQAVIDGHLAKRGYALPLALVPPLVAAWCRQIARYGLHKNRRLVEDKDPIARGHADALKLLALTAAGKFSLGADDGVANDKLDARFEGATPVFGRKQLHGFR